MTEHSASEFDLNMKMTEIFETQDQSQDDQDNARQRFDIANESSDIFQASSFEHEVRLKTENALLREQMKIINLKKTNAKKKIRIVKLKVEVANAAIAHSADKFKFKFVKSKKMRLYYDLSESEHQRWFKDVIIKYFRSFDYFVTDEDKILYCMKFLKNDSINQWATHTNEELALKEIIYDEFKKFLLNLVANSTNRRFLFYERWMKTEQKSNQRVTMFKIYLEKLKIHMLALSKNHRINFFLVKLKSNFKNLILRIDNVSQMREKILVITIMQKRTLERNTRSDDESENTENHSLKEDFENHKSDFEDSKDDFDDFENEFEDSKKNSRKHESGYREQSNQKSQKNSNHRGDRHANERFVDDQTLNQHSITISNVAEVVCYHCQKKEHFVVDCLERDRFAMKTQIEAMDSRNLKRSKNDETSQSSRKRSRNDQ